MWQIFSPRIDPARPWPQPKWKNTGNHESHEFNESNGAKEAPTYHFLFVKFVHGWLKSRDTEFGQETLSFCGVFLEERDGRLALAAGEVDCQMLNRCQSPSGVAGAEAAQVGA